MPAGNALRAKHKEEPPETGARGLFGSNHPHSEASQFFICQQGRERGGERGRSDITVCLLPHHLSMGDSAIANHIGSARTGGQIG